uniref:Retrotransposon Copia-like N-terminal domain-containing protein n=1 Tax=Manihot esculenta TaxID=3983 RepID=A0A2C9VDI3_MANES
MKIEDFEQWQKVDSMVISWILNSISKEILEAFLYTTTSHELWEELAQCFRGSNGPPIY